MNDNFTTTQTFLNRTLKELTIPQVEFPDFARAPRFFSDCGAEHGHHQAPRTGTLLKDIMGG